MIRSRTGRAAPPASGPAGAGSRIGSGAWRWPALTMFAVGYGANQFVPLLAVYRLDLALSDASATAVPFAISTPSNEVMLFCAA